MVFSWSGLLKTIFYAQKSLKPNHAKRLIAIVWRTLNSPIDSSKPYGPKGGSHAFSFWRSQTRKSLVMWVWGMTREIYPYFGYFTQKIPKPDNSSFILALGFWLHHVSCKYL